VRVRAHGYVGPIPGNEYYCASNTSILKARRLKGHACLYLAIQPPWVVCVRGRRHHVVFSPVEYHDRKLLEEPSDTADEKQRQAFTSDE
jgi:hypothetical protein